MPITPDDVAARQFAAIRRGYDPEEVDGFLAAAAADYGQVAEALKATVADLERERQRPEPASGRQSRARPTEEAARMGNGQVEAGEAADHPSAEMG